MSHIIKESKPQNNIFKDGPPKSQWSVNQRRRQCPESCPCLSRSYPHTDPVSPSTQLTSMELIAKAWAFMSEMASWRARGKSSTRISRFPNLSTNSETLPLFFPWRRRRPRKQKGKASSWESLGQVFTLPMPVSVTNYQPQQQQLQLVSSCSHDVTSTYLLAWLLDYFLTVCTTVP